MPRYSVSYTSSCVSMFTTMAIISHDFIYFDRYKSETSNGMFPGVMTTRGEISALLPLKVVVNDMVHRQ